MYTRYPSYMRRGALAGLPFVLVIVPFGMLFGVAGTEAGLNLAEVMGFSVLVIAGASQFTALHLLEENAPTFIVILTALAVNLRMAMYSAALAPHLSGTALWKRALLSYFLVDQSYAVSHALYEREPDLPLGAKLAYFAGSMLIIAPLWYLSTMGGAVIGQAIPPRFALDFAVPITFMALFAPSLRSLPHLLAATTSVGVALLLAWMPFNLGLIVAAACAMIVGAVSEIQLTKR